MASPTNPSSNTNTWAQMTQQSAKSNESQTPSISPTDRISQEQSLFLSDLDGGMAAVVISTPPSVKKKKVGGGEQGGESKVQIQAQEQGEEGKDGGDDWMPVTPKGKKTRLVGKNGSPPSTPEGRKSRAVMSVKTSQPNTPESKGKGRVTQPEAARSPPPSPWSPGRTYAQVLMGGSPVRMDLEKAKERAQGMAVLFGGGRGVVAEPVVGKEGEEGGADVAKEEREREDGGSDSLETVIIVNKDGTTSKSGDVHEKESESLEQSSSADASSTKGEEQEHEQEQEQQILDLPEPSTTAYRISTTTEQEQPVLDLNATAADADAGDADDDDKSDVSDQSSVFSDEEKDENQIQSGKSITRENASDLVEVEVNEEEIKQQDIQGTDETATPRILTYVSLHNEVKPQPSPYQSTQTPQNENPLTNSHKNR